MHCRGGVGRTGVVVARWLQEHGRTPDSALGELSAKWRTVKKSFEQPKSPETPEQVDWIKTWPQRRSVQQLMLCDRYRGALLGLAVGDALGTTLEFRAPGTGVYLSLNQEVTSIRQLVHNHCVISPHAFARTMESRHRVP